VCVWVTHLNTDLKERMYDCLLSIGKHLFNCSFDQVDKYLVLKNSLHFFYLTKGIFVVCMKLLV
jgi:hypothetical protein